MNQKIRALVLVALLLVVVFSESAGAWHAQPEPELPDELSWLPGEPPAKTGVIPVDQAMEDTFEVISNIDEQVNFTYRVLGGQLNDVEDEITRTASLPLTLYRDGAGGTDPEDPRDARVGGFGDVSVLGSKAWGHSRDAAFRGQEGYTTAVLADGTYPGHARSLLLTPEIDLRTNFFQEPKAGHHVNDTTGLLSPGDTPSMASTVYQAAYWGCDSTFFAASLPVSLATEGGIGLYPTFAPFCLQYRELFEQQDTYAMLEFQQRYNLAFEADGVNIMVFTEKPTSIEDANECLSLTQEDDFDLGRLISLSPLPCQVVLPQSQSYNRNTEILPENMGYTGFSPWVQDAVDLTPWMERSVWVGFYFASDRIMTPLYFENENRFNVDAGFNGFQLDDLAVKAPAAMVNLGVRPIVEPSFRPGAPGEYERPTLDPDGAVPVKFHVTNFAAREVDAVVTTRILHEGNRSVVLEERSEPVSLSPGGILEVSTSFTGLDPGSYFVQACVHREESGIAGGDREYCDRILDEEPGTCSEDPLEANPCNQIRELFFDMIPVLSFDIGEIQRDRSQLQFGDIMSLTLPVTNLGNSPESLTFTARPVSTTPPHDIHPELLLPEQRQPRTVVIQAGETKSLEWDIQGSTEGQFRLLVQVHTEDSQPVPFTPQRDLPPEAARPWQAFPKGPEIGFDAVDGSLTDNVWILSPRHGLGDGARIQVANDDDQLLIALRNVASPSVTLFFNDFNDEDILSGGSGRGVVVDGQPARGLLYMDGWVDSGGFEGEAARGDHFDQGGDPTGNFNYEIRVPIGLDGLDLDPGPDPEPAPELPGIEWVPPKTRYFAGDPGSLVMVEDEPDSETPKVAQAPSGSGSAREDLRAIWVYEPGGLDLNGRDVTLEWYGVGGEIQGDPMWAITLTVGGDIVYAETVEMPVAVGADVHRYRHTIENVVAPNPNGIVAATISTASAWNQLPVVLYDSVDYPSLMEVGAASLEASFAHRPYMGAVGQSISVVGGSPGGASPANCAWSTEDDGTFGDPALCVTDVTFDSPGSKTIRLTVDDGVETADATTSVLVRDTDAGSGGLLHAGPGDGIGVVVRFCDHFGPGIPRDSSGAICRQYPSGAAVYSGDGIHAADPLGDLKHELPQWHGIYLSDPHQFGGGTGFSRNVISDGFGVGTNPPPYLQGDFRDCGALQGWTQIAPFGDFMGLIDKWNCAAYADEGGRDTLYKGLSSASECQEGPCLPYAGLPGAPRTTPWRPTPLVVDPSAFDATHLWTPAFELPSDASAPTVMLAHQYSTSVAIEDFLAHPSPQFPMDPEVGGRIRPSHTLDIHLEEWVPVQGWVDRGLLEPKGGYPSEETVGIRDDRFPPRVFYQAQPDLPTEVGTDHAIRYSDPDCPPSVLDVELRSDGRFVGRNAAWPEDTRVGRVAGCVFNDQSSSWWWPQGEQPLYRPLDSLIPKGGHFDEGSPWVTDAVPLHGSHFEAESLNLAGGTYRLRLSFTTWDSAADHTPENDWGWRLGGLAVVEGDRFSRDVSIPTATLDVPFDPYEHGVGPEMTVPIRVKVQNDGLQDVHGITVSVTGTDVKDKRNTPHPVLCEAQRELEGILLAGEARNVTVECVLGPADPGAVVSLQAKVHAPGDQFPGNNHQRIRGHFPINAHADATVAIDAFPREASVATPRTIQVQLRNLGNVPLEDTSITLRSSHVHPVHGAQLLSQKSWKLSQPLLMGATVDLQSLSDQFDPVMDPEEDLRFLPPNPEPGTYIIEAVLSAPGIQFKEDRAAVRVEALDILYHHDFERSPEVDTDVMSGSLLMDDVWRIHGQGGRDGSAHLLAGDPARGEIPVNTDATVVLPELDLGTVKRATLSFDHRYDLESGFDAARVEMSVDGGDTWQPLVPRPQPLNDLPDGYSPLPLLGSNPILGDEVDCAACVFTGRSEDLPGNSDGWVTAEFDLTRQPHFWRQVDLESISLEGFHPTPERMGSSMDPRFYHESWLPDDDAEREQRHWWIDNRTFSQPQPQSAGRMWWSGSAGDIDPSLGTVPKVNTTLAFHFDSEEIAAWNVDVEDGERVAFRFWDWRAGWEDTGDGERLGTGGAFLVTVKSGGTDVPDPPVQVIERSPSGWTLREMDITHVAANGGPIEIELAYLSGPLYDWRPPKLQISAPSSGGSASWWAAHIQNNHGWFIDRVQVSKQGLGGEIAGLYENRANIADPARVDLRTGPDSDATIRWSSVFAGPRQSDGGWHVAPVDLPGKGTVTAWRFASIDGPGYPRNADSVLVTPVLDLRDYGGDSASFQFDHKYVFLGDPDVSRQSSGNTEIYSPSGRAAPPRAYDAGTVVFQTLDETTGTYGPWQTLGAKTEPEENLFIPDSSSFLAHNPWIVHDASVPEPEYRAMGYTAIAPRPAPPDNGAVQANDLRLTGLGQKHAGSKVTEGHIDFGAPYGGAWTAGGNLGSPRISWVDMNGNDGLDEDDHVYLNIPYRRNAGTDMNPDWVREMNEVRPGDVRLTPVAIDGKIYPAGTIVRSGDLDAVEGLPSNAQDHQTYHPRWLPAEGSFRWVDLDGTGTWSWGDVAYVGTGGLHEPPRTTTTAQTGDIRLTPFAGHGLGSRVGQGDSDEGLVFSGSQALRLCYVPVRPDQVYQAAVANAMPPPGPPAVFLSPRPCGSSSGVPTDRNYAFGYPALDTSQGWTRPAIDNLRPVTEFLPVQPYPFTYVFSGDSALHKEAWDATWDRRDGHAREGGAFDHLDGWDVVEWDISHLIGKQVRFGFHAWTGPTVEPCSTDLGFFGLGEANRVFGCHPLDGWTVANVAVQGQQFIGEPVQIRFRVATDESMPKGEWRIDNVLIAGERYRQAVTLTTDEPHVLEAPGTTVMLEGEVRNLGSSARSDLALAIDVAFDGKPDVPVEWDLIEPELGILANPEQLPPTIDQAHGPFDLMPGGRANGTLPIRIVVHLPESESLVNVDFQVLENHPECRPDPDPDGEGFLCEPRYMLASNELGSGSPTARWRVEGVNFEEMILVPPLRESRDLITVSPPIASTGQPVQFEAKMLNNGTSAPDAITIDWTVQRLERKGDPDNQKHTQEIVDEEIQLSEETVETPARGETVATSAALTPGEPGLYRVVLSIRGVGNILQKAIHEFMVGGIEPYYLVDFASETPSEVGWVDRSPPMGGEWGGSPSEIAFRHVDGQFLWGVTQEEFLAGLDYCRAGGCNPDVGTHGSSPGGGTEDDRQEARDNPVFGLHGIAEGPMVDLGRVVGDSALLTLRSGHGFSIRDGAVVEVLPLRSPVDPRFPPFPAFMCTGDEGNRPMWFRPDPAVYPGIEEGIPPVLIQVGTRSTPNGPQGTYGYTPARENPVGTTAIGGPAVDSQVLRFYLDKPPQPVCPPGTSVTQDLQEGGENRLGSLVNYTVQLRLRAGTTPGIENPNCERDWTQQSGFGHQNNQGLCDPRATGNMGWQVDSMGITSVQVDMEPKSRTLPMLDGLTKSFNLRVTNAGSVPETFQFALHLQEGSRLNASWIKFSEPSIFLAPGQARTVQMEVHVPESEPRPQRGIYAGDMRVHSTIDPSVFDEVRFDLDLREHLLPDLALQFAVESEGDAPEPGTLANIITTVHNLGRQFSDEVPLTVEVERVETGERLALGSTMVPALCPERECGDRSTHHAAFEWLPGAPGMYLIEAVVDPHGRLVQERTANSKALALIEVVPLQRPDPAVVSVEFEGVADDGYAFAGSLVTVKANITNLGVVPASNVEVRILSGTGELLQTTIPALQPGEVQTLTASRLVSAGESTVRVVITPTGDDLNIENNELRKILRVRGLELGLQGPEDPLPLTPGGTMTTRVDLTNEGNAVEKVLLRLDPAHEGWSLAATPNPVTISPESTAWSILTLRAPPDAKAGEHEIRIHGSPQSRPQAIFPTNVTVDVSSQFDLPRLIVEDAFTDPGPGELQVQMESRSNADQDLLLVLVEPAWDTQPREVTLPAAGWKNVTLGFETPAFAPPGETTTKVQVLDPDGNVVAQAHGRINVTTRPGGTAEWTGQMSSPRSDLETRLFEFTMNVTNTGNIPFVPFVKVVNLTEGARPVEPEGYHPTILPGGHVEIPVRIEASREFTARIHGEVEIYMQENPTGVNLNNTGPIARMEIPTLGALPDLTITDVVIRPRGEIPPDEPVQISVQVKNTGLADAPATQLYAYVNGDPVNAYQVEKLPPGSSTTLNMTWSFPEPGEYLLQFMADGPGEVIELHGDNNGWTQLLSVEPGGWIDRTRDAPGPGVIMTVLGVIGLVALRLLRNRPIGELRM